MAVRIGDGLSPLAVRLGRRWLTVEAIEDTWRIDDEWWRPAPLSRRYYAVLLAGGRRITVFRDLVAGEWFYQTY